MFSKRSVHSLGRFDREQARTAGAVFVIVDKMIVGKMVALHAAGEMALTKRAFCL